MVSRYWRLVRGYEQLPRGVVRLVMAPEQGLSGGLRVVSRAARVALTGLRQPRQVLRPVSEGVVQRMTGGRRPKTLSRQPQTRHHRAPAGSQRPPKGSLTNDSPIRRGPAWGRQAPGMFFSLG
jgi:hypothetical protein